jgi:hypothetical protein
MDRLIGSSKRQEQNDCHCHCVVVSVTSEFPEAGTQPRKLTGLRAGDLLFWASRLNIG